MTVSTDLARTIVDPKAYADGRIDPVFAQLRREAPVARIEAESYRPFWLVSRHADVMEAGRRAEEFHNGGGPITLTSKAAEADMAQHPGGVRTLVQMDAPDHLAFRRLTQSWFMPSNLKNIEGRIREIAREFVDRMADFGGECDFARDIALYYPLRVIMEILGVPEPDEPLMLKLTQEMFGAEDKDLTRDGAEPADNLAAHDSIRAASADFVRYFQVLVEDRKRNPRGDLASVIANGEVNGAPLGFAEVMGYYVITATAGHDTTSNTTASALWALAERPALLRELQENPGRIVSHVDESVRWATSVKHFMRTAAVDAELAGQKIAKGDWLMLSYASANRDEAVFERPFEYDINRSPNKHIAFGHGPHVCIGQHLGRMEMRILWEELLPRLSSLELAGVPVLTNATFIGGPKHVPIRFKIN